MSVVCIPQIQIRSKEENCLSIFSPAPGVFRGLMFAGGGAMGLGGGHFTPFNKRVALVGSRENDCTAFPELWTRCSVFSEIYLAERSAV